MRSSESTTHEGLLQVGELLVNTRARTVQRSGEIIDLPDLSFRLLLSLVRGAPERVTKEQLITEVWEGLAVSDETLTQRVRLLRQALGEESRGHNYIQTVRNQGYRLTVPVAVASTGDESATENAAERQPQAAGSGFEDWKTVAFLLLAVGLTLLISVSILETEPTPETALARGVAVLPFTPMGPDSDNDYFALGVHEELLGRLTEIDEFVVVPRRSILSYQDSDQSAAEIARTLNVAAIVEGSVRVTDDRVRINAQLIDGQTDRYLWSKSFERELSIENLFAIQAELAAAIADSLQVQLSEPERASLVRLPTENLEAYNLYLLGRYHTSRYTPADLEQAVGYLRTALEIDPEFAQAWAGLGWAYSFQGTSYGNEAPANVFPKVRDAALRALALNNELAAAYSLYGDILSWYDWDWAAAERQYQQALELDPSNALGYVLFLGSQLRHDEALALVEMMLAEFPQDPYVHINAAWRYLGAKDFERAIIEARLSGNHVDALAVQGWANLHRGDTEVALELFTRDAAARPEDPRATSNLALASIRDGDRERGRELLAKLLRTSETEYVAPELVAVLYFELDELDAGFAWLERAYEARSRGLIFLLEDPLYDPVRDDDRFGQLLARMGLG